MDRLTGHSAVLFGDKMVVYGGKTSPLTLSGEVLALDVDTAVWNRMSVAGAAPRARAFHSAVAFEGSMIVFGGLVAVGLDDIHYNMFNMAANADALPEEVRQMPSIQRLKTSHSLSPVTQKKIESSHLHALNLEGRAVWHALESTGRVPPTRCYHCATVFDSSMFVTGGYSVHTTAQPRDEELQAVYSTYSLNLRTMTWQEIVFDQSIPKRWGSSAVLSGTFWIHYGGIDIVTCAESPEIAVLNIARREWKVLAPGVSRKGYVRPRAMHTASRWGDRFYVFGGAFDLGGEPTNQLCQFDLLSGSMSVLGSQEPSPKARYAHSAVVLGEEMVIFGGTGSNGTILTDVWSLNLATGNWREWKTQWSQESIDNVFRRPSGTMRQFSPRGSVVVGREGSAPAVIKAEQRESTNRTSDSDAPRGTQGPDSFAAKSSVPTHGMHPTITMQSRPNTINITRTEHTDTVGHLQSSWDTAQPQRTAVDATIPRDHSAYSVTQWASELEALRRENVTWQHVTEHESAAVASEFMLGHDRILSPSAARKAILNCESPTALNKKRPQYVSPSLAKLGLR